MFVSEKRRLALLNRLIEVLGREEAEFLMDSLPPFDWHQLATKGDLKAMEDRLCSETSAGFAKVDAQLAKSMPGSRKSMPNSSSCGGKSPSSLRGRPHHGVHHVGFSDTDPRGDPGGGLG